MRDTFPKAAADVLPLVPATRAHYPRTPKRAQHPLPDAMAVRAVTVPAAAPPFDDEARQPAAGTVSAAMVGPPGHYPEVTTSAGQPPLRGRATPQDRATGTGGQATSQSLAGERWPSQFAQVLAETLAGARPQRQLNSWTSEQARKRISQLGNVLASDQRPRVRRILLCSPASDVLEMAVVVGFGPRTRALAIRLERAEPDPAARDSWAGGRPQVRWQCTAVEAA